jgi:microcystin-dependent protein
VDAIFIASAPHPEGPWTRYGVVPVIGNGYGGVSDLCSYPTQVSSTAWAPYPYRIYYRDDSSSNTDYCQSADGYTYSYVGTAINAGVALTALCGDNPETYGAGFYYWGGNWWASVNVLPVDCPTAQGGGIAYVDWLFMSTDGGNTFKIAQNVPLFQLQVSTYLFVGSRGSTYADPNGMYYMINQDNVPSSLYISRGYDLANWQTSSIPIATPVANLWGMTACNQTADACMVQSGGNVYVFYDGTDNSNETGRIGYMEYPGTLANLDACQNIGPTYTYTPTPTMTPSLTFTVVPTATACVTACTDKDRRRGRH